jgi:hypothetical protein
MNKHKPYRYLGYVPKGLEVTMEGGGQHKDDSYYKEDSIEDFQDTIIKKLA